MKPHVIRRDLLSELLLELGLPHREDLAGQFFQTGNALVRAFSELFVGRGVGTNIEGRPLFEDHSEVVGRKHGSGVAARAVLFVESPALRGEIVVDGSEDGFGPFGCPQKFESALYLGDVVKVNRSQNDGRTLGLDHLGWPDFGGRNGLHPVSRPRIMNLSEPLRPGVARSKPHRRKVRRSLKARAGFRGTGIILRQPIPESDVVVITLR